MKNIFLLVWFAFSMEFFCNDVCSEDPIRPIVIAHRGASGYLPEHTEGAKVLAVAQGADFIEQDVVVSRDGVVIVSHDITMHETTNVAELFANRKREDGKFYFVDFDWSEIEQLRVSERAREGKGAVFPNRFPGGFNQHLMRLADELTLIRGLEKTLNRPIGIYVELKGVTWHKKNNIDIAEKAMHVLNDFNYRSIEDRCYVQSFEADGLKRLRELKCELKLIELLGGRPMPNEMINERIQSIANYANGVGPSIDMIVEVKEGNPRSNGFVEAAHEAGLAVHPYTVRKDALPGFCSSLDELHSLLLRDLRVDGFFTDFPDLSRLAVDHHTPKR